MENVLQIQNLKYKNILKDITFSLEEKSFNILIGKNSSGKTTLINCIRGIFNYQGNINILNNNIKNDVNIYKNIGFFIEEQIILQNTLFYDLLNTLINLDIEEEKAKKIIYGLANKLDISHLLFESKDNLSYIDNILISFMFSIIHDPKLLIIEIDLDVLDEKNKNKIFNYIKSKKKLTVLLVTNNSEYFKMADKLLFLDEGKIVLTGKLEELTREEKLFIKCGSKLPFEIDLSNKLISYELIGDINLDIEKLVNEIWE